MIKDNDFVSNNIDNDIDNNKEKVMDNKKYKKKVTINENNNKNINFNDDSYDDSEDEYDYKDIDMEEIHPYKQNNDFYFPWYEQACECAENVDLVRYTKVDNTGDCLFDSLIILSGLNVNIKELRDILKHSKTIDSCEDPEKVYTILDTESAWGNKDVIYIFSEDLNQNICVHIYDSKKNSQGKINITYAHFKTNDTDNYIHLNLKASHYTPLLKIDEIDNYNIESGIKEIVKTIKANKNYKIPTINPECNASNNREIRPRRKPPWRDNGIEML